MFIATDFHIRIANGHLDDLRRHAAQRRRVRLARRAAPTGDRTDEVRVGTTQTPESRPCAVVSFDTNRSAAGRAA